MLRKILILVFKNHQKFKYKKNTLLNRFLFRFNRYILRNL